MKIHFDIDNCLLEVATPQSFASKKHKYAIKNIEILKVFLKRYVCKKFQSQKVLDGVLSEPLKCSIKSTPHLACVKLEVIPFMDP